LLSLLHRKPVLSLCSLKCSSSLPLRCCQRCCIVSGELLQRAALLRQVFSLLLHQPAAWWGAACKRHTLWVTLHRYAFHAPPTMLLLGLYSSTGGNQMKDG
jgi:hypothetical protein